VSEQKKKRSKKKGIGLIIGNYRPKVTEYNNYCVTRIKSLCKYGVRARYYYAKDEVPYAGAVSELKMKNITKKWN